jgi:hypothetical protein
MCSSEIIQQLLIDYRVCMPSVMTLLSTIVAGRTPCKHVSRHLPGYRNIFTAFIIVTIYCSSDHLCLHVDLNKICGRGLLWTQTRAARVLKHWCERELTLIEIYYTMVIYRTAAYHLPSALMLHGKHGYYSM